MVNCLKYEHHKYEHQTFNEKGILVNDVSHYPYSGNLLKNAFRINTPSKNDFNALKRLMF